MKKSKRKLRNRPSIDRLSALPDVILCHILSFLPTRLSVATAILSKRWRSLWSHVPNLEYGFGFHDLNFKTVWRFDDFYKLMLRYRVENMNKLTIHCLSYADSLLETCINEAITRNVKILDLSVVLLDKFPSYIFTCRSLVELRLCRCGQIPMSCDVSLPALKKLSLVSVTYESDTSLSRLLAGCPVLEELMIDRNDEEDVVSFYISSPTLKRLVLNSALTNEFDSDIPCTVRIDAPALRYLKIYEGVSKDVEAGALTSLVEARVYICNVLIDEDLDEDEQRENDVIYSRSAFEFVRSLCNVKDLKLSTGWLEVPDLEFSTWAVKFHNLTKLELSHDCDRRFIPYFLENADNLEYLEILRLGDDGYKKYWMEPKQVPACLLSHLETVIILDFRCTEQEFNMVRYILGNARVLKRMVIRSTLKKKFEALKRISLFKRGSVECVLAFH